MESFATLAHAVPTGMFDNRADRRLPARLFAAPGRTNDFRKLARKLFLVATNLDTGASVTFGAPRHDHVPISRAIEASSALPGLFPPVEIDGEHYVDGALNKTLHASVALDEGVDLLLCVNPLVPFDASGAPRGGRLTVDKLNQGGLPLVLSQTFRAIIHSRMKVGMEKYRAPVPRRRHRCCSSPTARTPTCSSRASSATAQRKRLCALAFAKTRAEPRARAPTRSRRSSRGTASRCDATALPIRRATSTDALTDPRPLKSDARRERDRARSTTRELAHTLDHLERLRWRACVRSARVTAYARPRHGGKESVRAARASASSRRASRCSTATASRTSRRRTSPTR